MPPPSRHHSCRRPYRQQPPAPRCLQSRRRRPASRAPSRASSRALPRALPRAPTPLGTLRECIDTPLRRKRCTEPIDTPPHRAMRPTMAHQWTRASLMHPCASLTRMTMAHQWTRARVSSMTTHTKRQPPRRARRRRHIRRRPSSSAVMSAECAERRQNEALYRAHRRRPRG